VRVGSTSEGGLGGCPITRCEGVLELHTEFNVLVGEVGIFVLESFDGFLEVRQELLPPLAALLG